MREAHLDSSWAHPTESARRDRGIGGTRHGFVKAGFPSNILGCMSEKLPSNVVDHQARRDLAVLAFHILKFKHSNANEDVIVSGF